MHYTWDARSISAFQCTSHRSRYLACDGLINLPSGDIPLYSLQHIPRAAYTIYAPETSILAVIAGPSCFFLTDTTHLERLVGLSKTKAGGNLRKLNTLRSIWKTSQSNASQLVSHLTPYAADSVESLYEAIIASCKPGGIATTMSARELQSAIPRSTAMPGVQLGIPLTDDIVLPVLPSQTDARIEPGSIKEHDRPQPTLPPSESVPSSDIS